MITTHLHPEIYSPEPGLPFAWQVPIDYQNNPGIREYNRHLAPENFARPAVSIVTALYKTYQDLHETAHSIFNQSLQQFEWIIIDDGNTDSRTLGEIEKWAAYDQRVTVVRHEKNRGLSAARNTGMEAASSDYILYLDSDDVMEPGTAEKLLWRMHTWPEIAFCRGHSVGFAAHKYVLYGGFHNGPGFLNDNLASNSGLMLRRSALGGVRYNEDRKTGLEDWEFWFLCASIGIWGGDINECCDWYRRRSDHSDRWRDYNDRNRPSFLREMKARYSSLWHGGKNCFVAEKNMAAALQKIAMQSFPCANRLVQDKPGKMVLIEKLGQPEKNQYAAIRNLVEHSGYDVTLAIYGEGPDSLVSGLIDICPDIFILRNFLDREFYGLFLNYLANSRGMGKDDIVVL